VSKQNTRLSTLNHRLSTFPVKPAQLRARVLAEWRGLPADYVREDRTATVADAVRKVMQSLGLGDRLKSDEVLAAWREIVGDFFAKHSSPQQLKDGVLYVAVLQPTVHFELDRVWKRDIIAKLKQRFGARTVREIKFRLG
jgi:predicted nucleic acid-binding Zn ribbon protein